MHAATASPFDVSQVGMPVLWYMWYMWYMYVLAGQEAKPVLPLACLLACLPAKRNRKIEKGNKADLHQLMVPIVGGADPYL